MALIKCPECGKEISDKAEKCLNCGYLLKNLVKCPECNNMIESQYDVCPCCGYPMKKEESQNVNKVKRQFKNVFFNKNSVAIIGMLFLIIFIAVGMRIANNNPYDEYVSYIGKDVRDLPSGFESQELMDGYWTAQKEFDEGDVKFSDKPGLMSFLYADTEFDAYNAKPDEVFSMVWEPKYTVINDSVVKKEIELLEKYFGKYDKKIVLDNTYSGYSYEDDGFTMTNYVWKDVEEKEISVRVEKEDNKYQSLVINIRKKPVES